MSWLSVLYLEENGNSQGKTTDSWQVPYKLYHMLYMYTSLLTGIEFTAVVVINKDSKKDVKQNYYYKMTATMGTIIIK